MKAKKCRFLNCKFWLDMLFPNRCPCCGRVIQWDKLLCRSCMDELPYLDDTPWQLRYSDKTGSSVMMFDYAVSAFAYESPAIEGIYSLKNGYGMNFAEYACKILCDKLENDGMCKADMITAVPMSRRKRLARGYNQAEVISEYLEKALDIPSDFSLLKRTKASLEQHTLHSAQRREFADRIYYIAPKANDIKDKTVIICDDVFTTGATMNKCAGLLKEMGAAKVYCVSICCTEKKLSGIKE